MRLSVLFSLTNRARVRLLAWVSYIPPTIVGLLILAGFLPRPVMFDLGDGDDFQSPKVLPAGKHTGSTRNFWCFHINSDSLGRYNVLPTLQVAMKLTF
jgi:hypothetical protein